MDFMVGHYKEESTASTQFESLGIFLIFEIGWTKPGQYDTEERDDCQDFN